MDVYLAVLGIEIEREGERMMLTCLVVHLFTYTYTYKSLLWGVLGELNEIC